MILFLFFLYKVNDYLNIWKSIDNVIDMGWKRDDGLDWLK